MKWFLHRRSGKNPLAVLSGTIQEEGIIPSTFLASIPTV